MYTYNHNHSTEENRYLDAYKEVLNESTDAMKPQDIDKEQLTEILSESNMVNVRGERFAVAGKIRKMEGDEVLVSGHGSVTFKLDEVKSAILDPQTNVLHVKI
jgi:hypothetical protein